jgi:GTP:adenosylcobinamide-phosphate guanylyltransferase
MKQWTMRFTVLVAALISINLIPTTAHAGQTLTLIAEDSFDYSGNLVGQNGGSGFTSAWSYGSSTSNYRLSSPTLSYPGITSAGGYVNGCSVLNGQLCAVSRTIPLQSTGKVFIQMIVNFGSQTGGGTPNLRLYDDLNQLSGGVGANGGTYGSKVSILDTTLNPNADGSSSAGTLNGEQFVVLGIDYTENSTSLWLSPDMSSFNYYSTPTPSAIYESLAPKIQSLLFISRYSNMKFDELKIYKVTTTTDSAEDAEASRKEAERKRQLRIAQGKAELQQLLERGEKVDNPILSEADFFTLNPKHIEELNTYLAALPLAERMDLSLVKKRVSKLSTIENITGPIGATIYPRDLIEFEIIEADTPQKSRIISKILKLSQDKRDSIEKFNTLVEQEVAIVRARLARLAAVMAR